MVSALAMAGGLFYTSCGNDVNDLEAGKPAENAAVLIGDVAIPPSQIDSQIQQMAQQFGQSSLEPRMHAMLLTQAVNQAVQSAADTLVAEKLKMGAGETFTPKG